MAATGIKKIKLSPFVHKVTGKTHCLLVDLLKGRLFHLPPEGDVQELKNKLLEKGLAYETQGVLPFKFEVSLRPFQDHFLLRELQIRLTGACSQNCPQCGQICACTTGSGQMSTQVITGIIQQFKDIPLQHLLFTGGNPITQWEPLIHLKKELNATACSILFLGSLSPEWQERLTQNGITWCAAPRTPPPIAQENMSTQARSFFYHQEFNPCWGHQIAIDLDGSIKPCLWWPESLGNITTHQIKTMIAHHAFTPYWQLVKDKIETCQHCEFRYNCLDCRAATIKAQLPLHAKPPGCPYDPETGIWPTE